jgi:hypothetical protein
MALVEAAAKQAGVGGEGLITDLFENLELA